MYINDGFFLSVLRLRYFRMEIIFLNRVIVVLFEKEVVLELGRILVGKIERTIFLVMERLKG